jgi:AraC-like DNA-binding protein
MGSLAFVAAARAAWVLVKDPADPQRRLFVPIKNNLARGGDGLAFTIAVSPHGQVPVLRWEPEPISVAAENILAAARPPGRPDEEREHATRWLQEFLSQGPRYTGDVQKAADAHGISPRTLRRAFRDLGGEAVKQAAFGFGQWAWKLPGKDGQNPGGEFWPSLDFHDEFLKYGISPPLSFVPAKGSSSP